jgi:hypothetical protein
MAESVCKVCNGRMIDAGSTQVRRRCDDSNVCLCSYGGGCSVRNETNPWDPSQLCGHSLLLRQWRGPGAAPHYGRYGRAMETVHLKGLAD